MSSLEIPYLRTALLILGFSLTALYAYSHLIDGDVLQVIESGHRYATQNQITPYGSTSFSGASGRTPGALLAVVTGLPMKLWFSPWAALAAIALFHFVAYLLFFKVLQNFLLPQTLIFVTLLFWLNPWRLSEVFLWNITHIFWVTILHMWTAWHLSQRRSFFFSCLHAIAIFLALQIHMSFVILIFMTLILLTSRAMKPNWGGALTGIVIGLCSLLPFFLAALESPDLLPRPGNSEGKGFIFFGLVAVYPLLKGFWYWILFGSTIFQTHVFHQVHFDYLGDGSLAAQSLKILWTAIKYGVGVFGVGLSFYVNYAFYKKHKSKLNIFKTKMARPEEWLAFYTVAAFLSALLATAMSPTLPIYWHLIMVWPLTLVPLLLFINSIFAKTTNISFVKVGRYFWVLVFYFTFSNAFAALGSKKHDIRSNFHDLYHRVCQENCSLENLKEE